LTVVGSLNLGGFVPLFMTNYLVKNHSDTTVRAQQYFQKRRPLAQLTAKDGEAMAEAMMIKIKGEKENGKVNGVSARQYRIGEVFSDHLALRQLSRKHPHFEGLMAAIISNKFGWSKAVDGKLLGLTEVDSTTIGEGFALLLITNFTPQAAVDEWVHKYVVLQELEERYDFFRPMMEVVARRVLATSNNGAKMRAYSGATLSLVDMGSDCFMFEQFYSDEEYYAAYGILFTICANMALQLLIVFTQNNKMGWRRMATEVLVTILCLKPAVDAVRFAKNDEKDKNLTMSIEMEASSSKLVEVVLESIPSSIIQMYVLLNSKHKSKRAMMSIFISALTIAFVSTSISFSADVDPKRRRITPEFYGYIKNDPTSRTVTFLAMMSVSTSHVLAKTVASALVIAVNGSWLLYYLVVDMAAYLLLKMARRDLRHCLKLDGALSWIASVLYRFFGKIFLDFTGYFHARYSFEVGGILWLSTFVQNQAACFVAAMLYLKYREEEEASFSAETLFGTLLSLLLVWVLSLVVFVCYIDRSYLHTFYGTTTGPQFCELHFKNAKTDESKLAILKYHESYYKAFEDEMKVFIADNWDTWMANQPDWLTENVIATVPDEYLPKAEVERLKKLGGGQRRRSSVGHTLGFVEVEGWGGGGGAKVVPMSLTLHNVGEKKNVNRRRKE
jgi:hypothetical protein